MTFFLPPDPNRVYVFLHRKQQTKAPMNPKLIQLIIAVIAAVLEAIKKDRTDPGQLPQARTVMSSVDEIIREGDVKGEDADRLRNVAQETLLTAAAAKPPTDEHIETATTSIDKLDREGTAGREDARQQKTEELRKREEERRNPPPPDGQRGDKPSAPAENQ